MNNESSTTKVFNKRFWLHKDPFLPTNFNEIFKSRTEPILDDTEKAAILSREAHLDGDMIIHVSLCAKSMLPKQLWDWVEWGEKVELDITVRACKKKLVEPITDMITKFIEEDKAEGQEYLKTHDHMLFVSKDSSVIHERQFVLHTPYADGSGKKNVEYINSYGEIIHHSDSENPHEHYIMLGYAGDVISPKTLGVIWGNDPKPVHCFKEYLVKAYQYGLRFEEAPADDKLVFDIEAINNDLLRLSCKNEFYGFGDNLTFSISKDFQENQKKGTQSIEKSIISVIHAYRWFFNRPMLHAVLKSVPGKKVSRDIIVRLNEIITQKTEERMGNPQKSTEKNKAKSFFDPKKLRTKSLLIPYAEENL